MLGKLQKFPQHNCLIMPQDTSQSLTLKAYDLLKKSIPTLNNLPKSQRFLLSDRILNLLSDLLETIIEAYYAPQHEKRPLLNRVNLILEKLRYFYRLCYDLGYFNSKQYQEFAAHLDEIGRMTGGWLKSLKG